MELSYFRFTAKKSIQPLHLSTVQHYHLFDIDFYSNV